MTEDQIYQIVWLLLNMVGVQRCEFAAIGPFHRHKRSWRLPAAGSGAGLRAL